MASGKDMKAATQTYEGFVKAATWGTVVCFAVAAVIVALIAS